MILSILNEQKRYARLLAENVFEVRRKQETKQKFSQNLERDKAANYVGFLAEVIMADFLKQNRPSLRDRPDEFDFIVNWKNWDVKVSQKKLVKHWQYVKKAGLIDFFVFTRLDSGPEGGILTVLGYLPYESVKSFELVVFPNGSKAYKCSKLRPFEELYGGKS